MTPELVLEDFARNESLLPSWRHKDVIWLTLTSSGSGKEGRRKRKRRSLLFSYRAFSSSLHQAELLNFFPRENNSRVLLPTHFSFCFLYKVRDLAVL